MAKDLRFEISRAKKKTKSAEKKVRKAKRELLKSRENANVQSKAAKERIERLEAQNAIYCEQIADYEWCIYNVTNGFFPLCRRWPDDPQNEKF